MSASMHGDEPAVLRREGDAPDVNLLLRRVVGFNHEVPQYRSKDDVHLDVGEGGTDAAAGPTAERYPRRWSPGADEPVRVEGFRIREDLGVGVHVGDRYHHRDPVRDPPVAEVEMRRLDVAACEVDDGPVTLQLNDCGLPELVAAFVVLLDELGENAG